MIKNKVSFQVSRSKWLRGEGYENTFLLREKDGKMCCLGFLAMSLGNSTKRLKNTPSPCEGMNFPKTLSYKNGNTKQCALIQQINDDKSVTDQERERDLKREFSFCGINVEFVP